MSLFLKKQIRLFLKLPWPSALWYTGEMQNWSARAEVVYARTYSRPVGDTFETWEETIDRVINHQEWLWQRAKGHKLNERERAELDELKHLLLQRRAMVAGRTLWLGGTELVRRRESSMFNCSHVCITSASDIVDAFWLLLQGCGVGFTPRPGTLNGFSRPIPSITVINSTRSDKGGKEFNEELYDAETRTWTIRIGDSGVSWAKAIGKLVAGKRSASKLVLDFSEVRPAGGRLAGYGWISQGDVAFSKALLAIAHILNKQAGQMLSAIDILDIMNHLGTALSTRRSAEIALYPADGIEAHAFASAKKDYWTVGKDHRAQSNNSLVYYSKPPLIKVQLALDLMLDCGGSEPGLINAAEALRRAPYFKGVNPCVTGDTLILTKQGYVPIRNVIGSDIEIWNGEVWSSVKPFSTGVNKVVRVNLSDGSSIDCTEYHEFILKEHRVPACDLVNGDVLKKFDMPVISFGETHIGDAYSQGFYAGDGNEDWSFSWLYKPKYICKPRLIGNFSTDRADTWGRMKWTHNQMPYPKFYVPVNANLDYRLNWLAGLMDADGTVTRDKNGNGLQLTSINRDFLCQIRLMLTTMGVCAKICKGAPAGLRLMPDGKGGSRNYQCQESYRLVIGNTDTKSLLDLGAKFERLVLHDEAPQRDARQFVRVVSVEPIGEAETFCFTDKHSHRGTFNGIVTGQCAEILLPDKGFCNLVTVDVAKFKEDWAGMLRAVQLIARANYRQTQVNLNDEILQNAWHENNEFLRLCGVSLTGIAMRPDLTPYHLKSLRNAAIAGAYSMAEQLDSQLPKNITTIKPEGTLSKLMDTTEGIHDPLGEFIFNNINFSALDPIVSRLEEAGYETRCNPADESGVIVKFPIRYKGIQKGPRTAIQQLERYRLYMDNYVDQNASITVSYDEWELKDIAQWLHDNWDSYVGVSFIKRHDPTKSAEDLGYKYLPQEVVDEATWTKYNANLRPLKNLTSTSEIIDADCQNGVCPVR